MSQDDKETLEELQRIQVHRMQMRVDRLFNDVMPTIRWLSGGRQKACRPLTDVYETDEDVIVKVETLPFRFLTAACGFRARATIRTINLPTNSSRSPTGTFAQRYFCPMRWLTRTFVPHMRVGS